MTVRFLAGYKGLLTHWDRGTVPCLGHGECPPNRHRKGSIWKGYAPVQVWEDMRRVWVPFVLEVTESLEEQLRGQQLRGQVWTLLREAGNKGKTSAVYGVFCEQLDAGKITEPFDVEPILCRVFHVTSIKLGAANPMPPKVCLEPVADDAPRLPAELVEAGSPELDEKRKKEAAEIWRKFQESRKRGAAAPPPGPGGNGKHETNGSGSTPR